MIVHWWRVFAFELLIIFLIIAALGYVKLPKFLRRRRMIRGFPWGYYIDKVPKSDPGFCNDKSSDFLHNVGTGFGGPQGFGEFGEFTGFGEMGEYGALFGDGGSD